MRAPLGLVLLLAACATTTGGGRAKEAEEAARPDAKALAIPTRVVAREVRIVLSDHWRPEGKTGGLDLQHPDASTVVARGAATFELRGLKVEASDLLSLTYLPDHENLLVHAREVRRFEQVKGYGHRTEDAGMVTMANDQVSIFER